MEEIAVSWADELRQALPEELRDELKPGVIDPDIAYWLKPRFEFRLDIGHFDGCCVHFTIVVQRSGIFLTQQLVDLRWEVFYYSHERSTPGMFEKVGTGAFELLFRENQQTRSRTFSAHVDERAPNEQCHWVVLVWSGQPEDIVDSKFIWFSPTLVPA